MNVGELKAQLADYPDDWTVLVARDEEGNGFHVLEDVEQSQATHDDEWNVLHPDDVEDYDDEDLIDVIVVWP